LHLGVTVNNSGVSALYDLFGFVNIGTPEPLRAESTANDFGISKLLIKAVK